MTMSRSPRRANARALKRSRKAPACCRTASTLRSWTYGAKETRWQHTSGSGQDARAPLRAAFEKESIEQQQDHGADDRHDPAGDIILARKDATEPSPYQCAGDTQQNRDDATTGIFPRHQQLCDRTDN